MRVLQLNPYGLTASTSSFSLSYNDFNKAKYLTTIHINSKTLFRKKANNLSIISPSKIRVLASTISGNGQPQSATSPNEEEEEAMVKFAFVHSVLFPDGTPDVQYRKACGGQKLRDIMLDGHIELYGPYSRPLTNCAGGGTCGTCIVEVVEGKELLSPRTETEKEKLKRKPRNWRLACQTTVGTPESRGTVVIQQLPEWKGHEWDYKKLRKGEKVWPGLRPST